MELIFESYKLICCNAIKLTLTFYTKRIHGLFDVMDHQPVVSGHLLYNHQDGQPRSTLLLETFSGRFFRAIFWGKYLSCKHENSDLMFLISTALFKDLSKKVRFSGYKLLQMVKNRDIAKVSTKKLAYRYLQRTHSVSYE